MCLCACACGHVWFVIVRMSVLLCPWDLIHLEKCSNNISISALWQVLSFEIAEGVHKHARTQRRISTRDSFTVRGYWPVLLLPRHLFSSVNYFHVNLICASKDFLHRQHLFTKMSNQRSIWSSWAYKLGGTISFPLKCDKIKSFIFMPLLKCPFC